MAKRNPRTAQGASPGGAKLDDPLRARFGLDGRATIVTGGSSGLGLACARALAEAGAAVVVASENGPACDAAAESLRAEGHNVLAIPCDVQDHAALAALVSGTLAVYGRLDTVVSAAGVSPAPGPMTGATSDTWTQVMGINLEAVWRLSALALPHLAAQPGGSLTFISSIAGLRGNRSLGVYGVSKAGLSQLARNLAVEWGPRGVRVNSVAPGLIRTPFSEGMLADPALLERRLSLTPLRRVGEPDEVAGLVLLLASSAGAFISGQTLVVDGGTLISDGN